MRGVYTVVREVTITSAGNLIELEFGAKAVEIYEIWVHTQSPDTAQQMTIAVKRVTAAGASGTTITPQSTSKDGTAATAIAYAGDRTPTAANSIRRESVPNIGGFFHVPIPEARIEGQGTSDGIVVRLDEDLSVAHILDCGITWREVG
jgi:hypothetical protein